MPTQRASPTRGAPPGLTVAVTGPTGDIGRALIGALEQADEVGRVLGMARRPLDPARYGWRKLEYRQGDVLDAGAVRSLVADADVVVHLAFAIFGSREKTRRINLEGSRHVFEATLRAEVPRLVYASSVAAYGFHRDAPQPLTEDVAPRGTDAFYYSAQKAELEQLLERLARDRATDVFVLRPCIVAGPRALLLIENIPYVQFAGRVPPLVRRLATALPVPAPVLPDTGVPFQLVHHDDVAQALVAASLGRGAPGVYNLAGPGRLTLRDFASQLGWHCVPVPTLVVEAAALAAGHAPLIPAKAEWLQTLRVPMLVDTSKAQRALGWRPRHGARQTLADTVVAARGRGLLGEAQPGRSP